MRERKTLNKPLLRKLALKLRRLRHEEHYDQTGWIEQTACGTAACVAGHLVLMEGWKPTLEKSGITGHVEHCRKGKAVEEIYSLSRRLLGLNVSDAAALFSGDPEACWPSEFVDRWYNAKQGVSQERPSRIAADLLDAIADGKVTL